MEMDCLLVPRDVSSIGLSRILRFKLVTCFRSTCMMAVVCVSVNTICNKYVVVESLFYHLLYRYVYSRTAEGESEVNAIRKELIGQRALVRGAVF